MTLRIRHPFWVASGFRVQVNGKPVSGATTPEGYAVVSRKWKTGDTVEVSLPMALRTEAFRDNPRRLAFLCGPIVLCGEAPRGVAPAIVTDDSSPLAGVKPEAGKPLCFAGAPGLFHLPGQSEGTEIELTPFYEMESHDYAVYWDVLTPGDWKAKQEAHEAEMARQREQQARMVDSVHPGERQSERDHHFAGETTYAGDFGDRHWRDARNGGWFAYELKVPADVPAEIVCTYWGSDSGREFDVLVDGVKVATQQLTNAHPGTFFEEVYPIPQEVLHGKTTITVRFQGHPGRTAGGVFGCMVLKSSPPTVR